MVSYEPKGGVYNADVSEIELKLSKCLFIGWIPANELLQRNLITYSINTTQLVEI